MFYIHVASEVSKPCNFFAYYCKWRIAIIKFSNPLLIRTKTQHKLRKPSIAEIFFYSFCFLLSLIVTRCFQNFLTNLTRNFHLENLSRHLESFTTGHDKQTREDCIFYCWRVFISALLFGVKGNGLLVETDVKRKSTSGFTFYLS